MLSDFWSCCIGLFEYSVCSNPGRKLLCRSSTSLHASCNICQNNPSKVYRAYNTITHQCQYLSGQASHTDALLLTVGSECRPLIAAELEREGERELCMCELEDKLLLTTYTATQTAAKQQLAQVIAKIIYCRPVHV